MDDALGSASTFVLTIEPDPDPGPSNTHLMGGDLAGGTGRLSVGHTAALGDDFIGASGSYILAVPSDDTGSAAHSQGIWWLDPGAGPGPSLDLPAGWAYERWVVRPSGPVSTSAVTALDAADSDAGGPAAGTNATPPLPGQDFIDPAMVLIGYAAVISIEPAPDNRPAPFTLKPLIDGNIEDASGGVLQAMGNAAPDSPAGSAAPEPATALMLLAAVAAVTQRRRSGTTV